jgi:hypothetical protein
MDTTPVQRRAPIVMLLVGAVGGAVGGWFAHRALVVPAGAASGSSARSEVVAQPSESSARQSLPVIAVKPSVQSTQVESQVADSARGAEIPLYSAAKSAPRASTSTSTDAAQPVTPSSQVPTLDDLLDSVNVRCTFGPGNGGRWPQGKLTVGDAAWQGGPVDFQSIDYGVGTAQMLGNVAHSRTGQVPVNVATTSSEVNFTGMSANGTFTVVTMFARLNSAGHHAAALSMHDGQQDIDTAQFYGFCDSALKRLN